MTSSARQSDVESRRYRQWAALPKATLVERIDISEDLMIMKLEPETEPFRFKSGQYCTLGLEGIERAYSIVSAPYEPLLEIFVELVPEGELTPLLWQMKLGDQMTIRPCAKGLFTMDQRVRHHFMVSTVTGVAPSISMTRHYLNEGGVDHKFYILLGASYEDELTYDKELFDMAAAHPDIIHFVPTVSRPDEDRNAGWTGAKGRVNNLVEEYINLFELPQDDTMVYTCGHPGMISHVKDLVVPQGWMFIEERFWKE